MADLEKTRQNLESRGFKAHIFATGAEASDYLTQTLHGTSIGIGGSATVGELGLYEKLCADNEVFWHWKSKESDIQDRAAHAKAYLCSANALSETGEIVNIDGNGNRVAATIRGPERVFLLVGRNKITPDLESAVYRARNTAAPLNARRLGKNTPCAKSEEPKCFDCRSPERICRALTILMEPTTAIKEFHVLLIDEDLGM